MDDRFARIGAGVSLTKPGGLDLQLRYAGEFSDDSRSNTGFLRFTVPF